MSIIVPKPKDEEDNLPTEQLITNSSLNIRVPQQQQTQTEPKQTNSQLISNNLIQRKALLSLKHTAQPAKTFKCKNILTLSNSNQKSKNNFAADTTTDNAQSSSSASSVDEISIIKESSISLSLVKTSNGKRHALRSLNKIPSFLRRKKTYGVVSDTVKENCLVPGAYTNDSCEESAALSIRKSTSKLSLSFNPLAAAAQANNHNGSSGLKRQAESTLSLLSSEAARPKKLRTMSMYDRQYPSSDDRPITNGYLSSRNSAAVHNDDNNVLTNANNYYSSSATLSGANGGSSNAILHAPSMASLCNIGNTCYLNSVVYTLRFAPLFLHNLHHLVVDLSNIQQNIGKHRAKSSSLGRNISGMHMENARSWSSKDLASLESFGAASGGGSGVGGQCETQKSSQQVATEKLHELYKSLHHNEVSETTEPFHADTFLHAIQEVSAIFEGNQQQDAHEFLMCVLDSIRETCQSLIKAISDCPDVIVNGCVSLPEHMTDSSPEQNHINHNINVNNNNNNNNNNSSSNNSSSSKNSSTNIMKTSFFNRKPKRKDDAKNSKNQRLQSPLKDNSQQQPVPLQQQSHPPVTISNSGVFSNNTGGSDQNDLKSSSPSGDDELMPIKDKERLAEKIKKLGLDFFTEDFEGMTVSTTKCLSCETVTEQKETMIDIAVPVPISGYTETSNSFIQNSCITREYFRDKNKYRCEQCTGYTEAIRSISYEVLPRLLVIQLSRFSGGMEKINSYIPTPFTMQCFCAKCEQRDSNNKLHAYKLYSVITHVGATMSVGHYIAYTCSLDWASDYINCPRDKRRQPPHPTCNGSPNSSSGVPSSRPPASSSSSLSTSTGLMKKIKFGRNKASSSGDMSSKSNLKNLNGQPTSKTITNGIEKLSMNTTCHSVDCCASRLRTNNSRNSSYSSSTSNSYSNGPTTNGGWSDLVDDSTTQINGSHNNSTSYGYMLRSKSNSLSSNAEPIWYMCDDDKIKAMTQREFEELLSPTRKITITPYLLFYARFDLQKQSAASDCGM